MTQNPSAADAHTLSDVRITGTGLFTPPNSVSNEELVEVFNTFVERWNADHASQIEAGAVDPLQPSSAAFIEKASGIKSRYVMDKAGILDPDRMAPHLAERPNEDLAILAEMAVAASHDALKAADLKADDIDGVICACSNLQRGYPAVAVEIQAALGIDGYGFDMNVACASAAFGIETGVGLIRAGARRVLMVNPEICTAHLNFRDRDSHFIFGDVATAVVLERADETTRGEAWNILGTRLKTVFSNNIRNNFGFLNRTELNTQAPADAQTSPTTDKLFIQNGRKVFKDVVPLVGEMIANHLSDHHIQPADLSRMWLHQANLSMNELIAKRVPRAGGHTRGSPYCPR